MEPFERVYRAELRGVWQFVRRLGVRGAATDDLTHEVFLTAMRRWKSFDSAKPAGPWLRGIAWKAAADYRRLHQHRETSIDDAAEVASGQRSPEQSAEATQALQRLERALATLDQDQRTVFVMHEMEGLSAPQISELMENPLPTTYSRLRLAREKLSAAIAAGSTR